LCHYINISSSLALALIYKNACLTSLTLCLIRSELLWDLFATEDLCDGGPLQWGAVTPYFKLFMANILLQTPEKSLSSKVVTVQSPRSTRSSSVVTISRPPTSSFLKITNRSFQHTAPRLWDKLPHSFRKAHPHPSLSPSHYPTQVGSTLSSPPFSPPTTPSLFTLDLKHTSSSSLFHYRRGWVICVQNLRTLVCVQMGILRTMICVQ